MSEKMIEICGAIECDEYSEKEDNGCTIYNDLGYCSHYPGITYRTEVKRLREEQAEKDAAVRLLLKAVEKVNEAYRGEDDPAFLALIMGMENAAAAVSEHIKEE